MSDAERLRAQLIAEKAYYKYAYGPADDSLDPFLTDELIRMLVQVGIADIRDIAFFDGIVPVVGQESVEYLQTAYFYNALTGQRIVGIGGNDENRLEKDVFAHTFNDSWSFTYYCRYTAAGVPYFLVGLHSRAGEAGSIWKGFAQALAPIMPVIMIVASIWLPGIATVIGEALMGAAAATYPLIASTLGNVVISTVLNGGNIETALKGAASSLLGISSVGDSLGAYLDSPALGAAATAAVSTAIRGGDIGKAVLFSMGSSGVQNMGDFFLDETGNPVGGPVVDPGAVPAPMSSNPADMNDPFITIADANAGVDFGSYPPSPPLEIPTVGDAGIADIQIPVYTSTPPLADYPAGAGDGNGTGLTDLAAVALQALKVYQAFQHPAVQPHTVTRPDGRTATAKRDGTLQTADAQGRSIVVKPAPGIPYALPGGGAIINNGDGTYTRVEPNGAQSTLAYAKAGAPGSMSTGVLLGLGLLGLLALSGCSGFTLGAVVYCPKDTACHVDVAANASGQPAPILPLTLNELPFPHAVR